jgi:oligopeptide/dipeptide ABC transporter ATP-binding protein
MAFFESIIAVLVLFLISNIINNHIPEEQQISKSIHRKSSALIILILFGIIFGIRSLLETLGAFFTFFLLISNDALMFALITTIFYFLYKKLVLKKQVFGPIREDLLSTPFIKIFKIFIILTWIICVIFLSISLIPINMRNPDIFNLGFIWAALIVVFDMIITVFINIARPIEKRIPKEILKYSMFTGGLISFGIWSIQLVIVELYLGRLFGIYLNIGGILFGVGLILIICLVGIYIFAPQLLPKKTVLMVVFLLIGTILSIISETFHLFLIGIGIFFIIWVVGIFIYGPDLLPINTILKIVFLIIGAILSIISGTFRLFLNILNAEYIQDIRILFGVVSLIYGFFFYFSMNRRFIPLAEEKSKLKIQEAHEIVSEQAVQHLTPEGNNAILKVQDLTTYFHTEEGVVHAVEDVSFQVYEGEVLGLVGETGCGKSVTALSILRVIRPPGKIEKGTVIFRGENLLIKPEKEMLKYRGKDITMIFQDPLNSLNPVFRIGKQISEVFVLHMENELLVEASKFPDKSVYGIAREWSIELLRDLNIPFPHVIIDRYPHELSGGMRQRVQIAMALACRPKLLIADEPTTALDVTIQNQILKLMKELRKKYNTTILFITHDLGIISKMCDRVAVMYCGSIVEYGNIKKLFTTPYHPYTRGLIASVPRMRERQQQLEVISGMVPNLIYPPLGCRFHPRCQYCFEPCSSKIPKQIEIEPEYFVRCHLYDPEYERLAKISIKKKEDVSEQIAIGGQL